MDGTPDLARWQRLCHFLNGCPRRAAYLSSIPKNFHDLLHPTRTTRPERERLRLVFYSSGWGWRLHKGWQGRLEELSGGRESPHAVTLFP